MRQAARRLHPTAWTMLASVRLSLIALAAAGFALAACGSSTEQPPPKLDPPRVFLTVPSTNVIDTQFVLTVNVDGCKTVKNITVLDRGQQVASLDGPTVPVQVTLTKDQVSFKDGIAATLSLTATATCDDDRTNVSQAQPGTFFPVAQRFHATDGQLVSDYFVVQGHTSDAQFIGCDGNTKLARVGTGGNIVASLVLPSAVPCTVATQITDRNATSGLRWVWTPGAGAIAVDDNLNIMGEALDSTGAFIQVKALGVGDDGDAVVMGVSQNGLVSRIRHNGCSTSGCLGPVWSMTPALAGAPLDDAVGPQGNPVITSAGVLVPLRDVDLSHNATYFIEKLIYATGEDGGSTKLHSVNYGTLESAPDIPMSMTPDGVKTLLPYTTSATGQGTFQVQGCPTAAGNCTGGWVAPGSGQGFLGTAVAAIPFGAGFPYVAAIGPQTTYFVRTDTGANVGKGGLPLVATGSLVTYAFQPGKAADFYVMNGGGGALLPIELVGVDSPQNGELFRMELPGGSLSIGVDDDGIGWVRVGNDLVQLLSLSEYRALRG